MENRCKFWLPRKNRFCANARLNGSLFCGNHNTRSDNQWIPCPIDPSHSVLEENLEGHVKRCPLLKQVQSLTLQPYYQKGINGGKEDEKEEETPAPTLGFLENTTSEMKRNAVYSMTVLEFSNLICKIEAIHSSICNDIRDSYKVPEACGEATISRETCSTTGVNSWELGRIWGIEESVTDVIGEQCESEGLAGDDNGIPAVVEFGAGRGYLTQMLADCYGIKRVFLVERKSYKLKADRSLRQKESLILERLRIDIEDLNLNAVESLREVPYLAIGKHLCGPATDLTLRCCLRKQCNQDNVVNCNGSHYLRGLAIATCCHHLCQWKHYISNQFIFSPNSSVIFLYIDNFFSMSKLFNFGCPTDKRYLSSMGINKEDFHAITWFTSWAVDADHGSDLPDANDCRVHLQSIEKKECGGDASGVEEIVRNMKAVERAVLGFMCKEIIDMGRLMWIKEHGLETQLVKYVPTSISPENHLLIAKHTNNL
ncbi:hypothetical protein L1049_007369 [Liquidambar formosana]|uniref:tRNA:m(4)X modification enzyme TRM13 n=1 Tax=Liquidambar formosana TaxID=63359 RepID=A0AAP0R5Q9_LIQFO